MLTAVMGLCLLMQQGATTSAAASSALASGGSAVERVFPEWRRFPVTWDANHPSSIFERQLRRLVEEPLGKLHGVPVQLGDLVRACAAAEWDVHAVRALLVPWEERMAEAEFLRLRDLVDCSRIYADDWDPDSDRQRAGFHFGPAWKLDPQSFIHHRGSEEVQQSANLVLADMLAYGEAARQWDSYYDFVGGSYEDLQPRPEDHHVQRDANGRIVAETMHVALNCDLPFPFGGYGIDLRLLFRVEEGGAVRGWFQGESDELHWYGGYDLFLPFRASDGEIVGMMQVRQTGVDIDGVPESARDRRNGMRTVVGNLRRRAEQRFLARESKVYFDPVAGLPELPMAVPEGEARAARIR